MDDMGRRERFEDLYAAHLRQIHGFAARRCETPADAADVASETFLVAWRRIDDVPVGDDARLWLYGIARHVLANHRRGAVRRSRLGQALLDAWRSESVADPAELFAHRQTAADARRAIAMLPERDRELLTLVSWEGLSPTDAATVLGISPVAARSRLSRARRRLRRLTQQYGHVSARGPSYPPTTSATPAPLRRIDPTPTEASS